MKKVFITIILTVFCNYWLGGLMIPTGLDAIEKMAVWVYLFKENNDRLPQSLNELINETPCEPSHRIRNLFASFKENYTINLDFFVENKIIITIEDGINVFIFENKNEHYFFYINERLVIEYMRDETGAVIDRKEYFTIDPANEFMPFQSTGDQR